MLKIGNELLTYTLEMQSFIEAALIKPFLSNNYINSVTLVFHLAHLSVDLLR